MTTDEQSIARNIVDQWFWQPAEGHNYHYRGALRTLVRFYESAPMEPDVVRLVIEYLRDEEVDGGISLMNKSVDLGSGWKAMDAWYRTDETEKWNGTDSRKVRVYQVLVQKPDATDSVAGPFQTENGCQYAVSHEFHWNVESLPTVPASSSGVNYTLEGAVRDQETGLYSCVVVRRERVQQDVEEYLSQTTLFEDTKEEAHFGVKGASTVGGKPASVSKGKAVTRKVSKNSDCTHDVQNVTTEGKPVSDAVIEFSRTLHGTQKSVTHRNQQQPVSDEGIKLGERRTTRKTDLNLNDNTIVKRTSSPVGKVAKSQRNTIFEESTSERTVVEAKGAMPEHEAEAAGNGKTHSVDVQLYDDDTAEVVVTDKKEKPVKNAVVEIHKTLRGTTRSVTDRNQPAPVDEVGMAVGETRISRKTDGELYDNTTTTTKATTGKIMKSCEMSAAEHIDTETKTVPAENAEAGLDHVDEPEVNTVVEKSVRKNDDGQTADVVTRRRHLKKQEGNGKSRQGGNERMVDVERTENAEEKLEEPTAEENQKVEVSNTPNGAGGFNTVKTTTKFNTLKKKDIKLWEDDENEAKFTVFRNLPFDELQELLPTDNTDKPGRKSVSLSPNDHGTWDGSFIITKPRTDGNGKRVIEIDKDETFVSAPRYGRWEWTSGLAGMAGLYGQVWEYRRICTMRVRWTGLTPENADAIKSQLDSTFTRQIFVSEWVPNATPGYFRVVSGGQGRMSTKVLKYHIAGDIWGVLLDVNEVSTRLTVDKFAASSQFGIEAGWSYALPSVGDR